MPWPKALSERVREVEAALKGAGAPVEAVVLSKQFARAKPDEVEEILVTLVTLGRARQRGDQFSP